ncbi:peptidoglycan-recognition protein SB1-like [Eupeodes corollae]|uniref:peptidoglycan-recognition protein SB1-like n=1 Tax=Eupeodes corollae TaxID=290404 RepID=UPI00249221E3|nr:peptidoglycan-recognition protein SB1-like [Eupeodes corollae]
MNSKLLLVMAIFVASAMVIMAESSRSQKTTHHQELTETNLKIIKRSEWNAAKPIDKSPLNSSVPYVIVHHSASPPACYTRLACQNALRSMQRTHQLVNGWDDIGYNFLIGADDDGDGEIYEGRGFGVKGAHAPGYNYRSIGICLIGNWSESVPPQGMLDKMKQLINYGVEKGHIQRNYRLHGHRQVKATECPGKALQAEIEKWEHFRRASRATKR